ncbi:MAG: DUF4388 domain-containing protein [Actinomycetota bacterium]|nr:DUF4388 domain-containing protein [Actinomycetota bacterium]
MLRGSLDDFSLEDIFWLVSRAENSGELMINRPAGFGRFFFREGRVDHVETDLLRGSARALENDPRRLVEEAAFEVLRRDLGDFSWTPGEATPTGSNLSLAVEDLLAAADERRSELAIISEVIPSERSILTLGASPPEHIREITLTRAQWSLLAFLDGRRTVEAVAREADLSEFFVLRALFPIAERGLLEVDANAADATATDDTQIDLTDSSTGSVSLVRAIGDSG